MAHANEEELKCCALKYDITWWYEFSDVKYIFSAYVKCMEYTNLGSFGNTKMARKNVLW